MLNLNYQYIPAKTSVYIPLLVFVFIFICNIPTALADEVHYKDQILNKTKFVQELPTNLNEISLTKLKLLKKDHESKLVQFQSTQNNLKICEKKLLDSLIAYDDVRLKIAEVIIKLVDEYNVTGSYKKKLLGYSDTFNTKIKSARNNVQTLDEYKVYGTHFAVAYISLIYTFKENSTFYTKHKNHIKDSNSTIGKYLNELDISYQKVEKAQKEYQSILVARKIKESIAQLDEEINFRKERLITQNSVDLNH